MLLFATVVSKRFLVVVCCGRKHLVYAIVHLHYNFSTRVMMLRPAESLQCVDIVGDYLVSLLVRNDLENE